MQLPPLTNQDGSHATPNFHQKQELVGLIERMTGIDGKHPTAITPLTLWRLSAPSQPVYGVQKPCFCIAVQGSKQARLGDEVYLHDPSQYLLISVDLPIAARIVQATPETPYLGFCLDIDPVQIGALLMETNLPAPPTGDATPSLSVSPTDEPLMDAVVRLLCLLDSPRDIPVLAPLAIREIMYRLLSGPQGARLRQSFVSNSLTQRIRRAVDLLKLHYAEPLPIERLAREAHMSVSGLHHHFKAVTSLSPLQYQKHLRLGEARRLMLQENLDATTASYRVGYNSPTQFSREYRCLFGAPPLRDIAQLRGVASSD